MIEEKRQRSSKTCGIAFYGGSFDPPHNGHLAIGTALLSQFNLQSFVFMPAFHAPHKPNHAPASSFHRFAMLALATADAPALSVSTIELEKPERPFTVETLARIVESYPPAEVFFVMGADSWADIRAWRDWESLLTMTNHIVVTRPGFPVGFGHVPSEIRKRIVDLRNEQFRPEIVAGSEISIYISDAVQSSASANRIRREIKENSANWRADVPNTVANYIEKYELYK